MRLANIAVVSILAFAAAACAPSEQQYNAVRSELEASSASRQKMIAQCVAKKRPAQVYRDMALIADVPVSQVAKVVCTRITRGLANGRLSYADVRSVWSVPTPNVIKVLQGR